ncbi:MOSC domain-containing protein [uncultured Shewanella sp.]|uniref:MOSC domain-containing protein n=1 Tax=uncultured Shewanella sp. TaxID=173975 RepID=UPI002613E4DA|nr:MOSC domain-containing protein [uncultured Shewanella sp.]
MEGKQLEVSHLGLYRGENTQFLLNVETSIDQKIAVSSLNVEVEKIVGDSQADKHFHGGIDRVVYHYPLEHYAYFRQMHDFSGSDDAPRMGENMSTQGLTENDLNIGDVIQIGGAVLQVSQPRSPCFKVNFQFDDKTLSLIMQRTQRCGWLYRVITPGVIQVSDSLVLQDRISTISVATAIKWYFSEVFNEQGYEVLAKCPGLAVNWKNKLEKRLATGTIEDWQTRLYGS